MASYVVMEPAEARPDEASDGAVFIRDGFSIVAFLVPPLWLLWHKLWIEAAFAVAIMVGLTALGEAVGFGLTGSALSLLMSIFAGLEGSALRVAALRRRGWSDRAAIEADNLDEAEIRYLSADADAPAPPLRPVMAAQTGTRPTGPVLGLFDYPGRS